GRSLGPRQGHRQDYSPAPLVQHPAPPARYSQAAGRQLPPRPPARPASPAEVPPPGHRSGSLPAGQADRSAQTGQPARHHSLTALAAATPRSATPQHPTLPLQPAPTPSGAAASHNAYRSTGPTHPQSGSPQHPRPGSPAHRWSPSARQRAPPCPAPAPQHAARAPPPSYPQPEAPSARTKSPTATAATSPHASVRDHR